MKIKNTISAIYALMFMVAVCFTVSSSFAQTSAKPSMMKDCCMMKDSMMMYVKDGKMMPMKKDMTMKNGTTCMVNGECVMKDGTKMKMKEGECMDMSGMMSDCGKMMKETKTGTEKKTEKAVAAMYVCPMHPEETSTKPDKCGKCGMDMVKKN